MHEYFIIQRLLTIWQGGKQPLRKQAKSTNCQFREKQIPVAGKHLSDV